MIQLSLLNESGQFNSFFPRPEFHGKTYEARYDLKRLSGQLECVYRFMLDHQWHTLSEISGTCNGSEASISARLRDLRKPEFGGHTIERQARGDREHGLFEYRMAQ